MPPSTIIYIAGLALLIFWVVGAHNRLVRLKNSIAKAFGPVDLQLKRRYDLITGLVEVAEKYLQHERATLDDLVTARNRARTASDVVRSRPANAQAVTTLAASEQTLDDSLERLFAVAHVWPEMKTDEAMRGVRSELANIDNQMAFASHAYNGEVLNYNHAHGQFPVLVVARLFSFVPAATLPGAQTSADARSL